MGFARFRHVPGDPFADPVPPQFPFCHIKTVRGFDHKGIAPEQGKGSAQHTHAAVEYIQNPVEQGSNVLLVNDGGADLLQDRDLLRQ